MATYSNVKIRNFDPLSVIKVPVASATVIAPGDLIILTGATSAQVAQVVATGSVGTSGNTYFGGVAIVGSESGDIRSISVATRAVINIKIDASGTDSAIGTAYKYSSGANGTDWDVTTATALGIMWALEYKAQGSYCDMLIDTHALKGGFIFDTCT